MRFLCLHGAGTNNQVLETQTAAIRYELDDHHTFEFVEGTLSAPIASEIKSYFPESEQYFVYFNKTSATSVRAAIAHLATYISLEGPFDGILGYSHGAALAATFLIQHTCQHPEAPLPVKCAVFLSGGKPVDLAALDRNELKLLDAESVDSALALPTANIWGRNDRLWPGTSEVLSSLCEKEKNNVFVHEEGHDIPSVRAKLAVSGAVRVIRRAVDQALGE